MSEYAIGQDGRLTTVGVQSTNGLSPIAADTRLTVIRSFLSASEISRIFKEVEPTPTPTPASTPDASNQPRLTLLMPGQAPPQFGNALYNSPSIP